MDDPTVTHVFHAAIRSGLFSTVVRYNMRGAGASKAKWSKASFLGEPDVEDMLAVCQYVTTQLQDAPIELFMIGYSYGACVAANSLAQLPQVVGVRFQGPQQCFHSKHSCTNTQISPQNVQMLLWGQSLPISHRCRCKGTVLVEFIEKSSITQYFPSGGLLGYSLAPSSLC
jgi:alpha/beta superfamily hydrolase